MCSLNDISPGEIATVLSVRANGGMRRRLQDIGIIRGTKIKCVGKSPLGDPCAYLIRGKTVAIRCRDAAEIKLKK